jgi:tetratricopeptide (TPR) repeat protein
LISGGMVSAQTALPQSPVQISQLTAQDYFNRGFQRLDQEDYQGAIADFNQTIQFDPTFALTYVGRGVAKFSLGDYQGAIADHNQAIKLDPKFAPAYAGRGAAKAYLEDYQGAISDLNQAIQLDPKNASTYANRSEGFTLLGKVPEALQDAEQAIRLDPTLHYGYVARGAAHVSAGNFAAAQTDLEQALRLNPKEGFIYYWRGRLALKQGKYEQAISDYEQGVRLTPTVAAKGYENYSLTARRQLNAKVATPAPPVTAPESLPNSPKQPAPNPVATSTSNVYKTAQATTLLIEGQNSGSGVLFSKSANTYYLLTAKHVVATPDEYRIVTPSGKTYAVDYAQIVKLTNSDLAVVPFTSSETLSLAQFGNSQALNQGDEIYISGWPVVDEAITKPSHLVTPGVVVGIRNENKDGYELFYNNSTGPGMSGGPIFNRAGQMIGIHGRASGNPVSGKVGINLGVPVHLFLQQASKAGLNLQRLGLRVQ